MGINAHNTNNAKLVDNNRWVLTEESCRQETECVLRLLIVAGASTARKLTGKNVCVARSVGRAMTDVHVPEKTQCHVVRTSGCFVSGGRTSQASNASAVLAKRIRIYEKDASSVR